MTPEFSVTIPRNVLKALALFLAKKYEVRYYLKGVLMSIRKERMRLVATNGHVLAVANIPTGPEGSGRMMDIILPPELVACAKKGKSVATIGVGAASGRVYELSLNDGISVPSIDGIYPKWESIVPAKASGEKATYNPDYLELFNRAAMILHGGKKNCEAAAPVIAHNGLGAGVVTFPTYPDMFALVMPLRP